MEKLERAIVEALARTEPALSGAILLQYANASVTARKFTGVGFYTSFTVPSNVPRIEGTRNPVGQPILIELQDLQHGASAVLWLKDGTLAKLEVFTFAEPWPETVILRSISSSAG